MSKHTPGPWTVKVSPHDNRVVLIDSKTHGAIERLKGMAIHPSHYAALEAAVTKAEAA